MYSTRQVGSKYSTCFKLYIIKEGKTISPFHDIPLKAGSYFSCVNEIPRFEHGKFEISKDLPFNPICQDVKKEKPRFVKNVFPTSGYPFNYGAMSQTWEDPSVEDDQCKAKGDNDPVDVIEIGSKVLAMGQVYKAKVLGAIGLIDDGEADWKILVVNSEDKLAATLNNLDDIRKACPDLLEFVYKWLRVYKVPDGKPKNEFALEGKFLEADEAKKIIEKAHESWKKLMKESYKDISTKNSTLPDSSAYAPNGIEVEGDIQPDSSIPEELNEYYYIPD